MGEYYINIEKDSSINIELEITKRDDVGPDGKRKMEGVITKISFLSPSGQRIDDKYQYITQFTYWEHDAAATIDSEDSSIAVIKYAVINSNLVSILGPFFALELDRAKKNNCTLTWRKICEEQNFTKTFNEVASDAEYLLEQKVIGTQIELRPQNIPQFFKDIQNR